MTSKQKTLVMNYQLAFTTVSSNYTKVSADFRKESTTNGTLTKSY
jgi:hypothetical protein